VDRTKGVGILYTLGEAMREQKNKPLKLPTKPKWHAACLRPTRLPMLRRKRHNGMNHRILALSALAMLTANVAHATTYFDSISAPASFSGNSDGPSDGATLLAQSFSVPGTPNFNTVTLGLNADVPSDGGSTMVFLVPDDGTGAPNMAGFPQTTLDATSSSATGYANAVLLGTIKDSSLGASGGSPTLITLSISPAAVASVTSQTSNGEYWIGLVTDGSSSIEWDLSSDGSGVGLAGQDYFNNAGSSFGSIFDPGNGTYELRAGVPEPATLAILGAGLAGIGYARRRQAKKA
jgi:hypothetical protein